MRLTRRCVFLLAVASIFGGIPSSHAQLTKGTSRSSSPFTDIKWDVYTFRFLPGNQMAQVLDANGSVIGTILAMNGGLQIMPTITGADAEKLKAAFQSWKDQGGEKALNGAAAASRSAKPYATASSQPAANATRSSGANRPSSAGAEAQASATKPAGVREDAGGASSPGIEVGGVHFRELTSAEIGGLTQDNLTTFFDLNLFRANPDLLNDPGVMKYFAYLNSCGMTSSRSAQINGVFRNELDYPQVADFYRGHAKETLLKVPQTPRVTFGTTTLGTYDTTRKIFPIEHIENGRRLPMTLPMQIPLDATNPGGSRGTASSCSGFLLARSDDNRLTANAAHGGTLAGVYVFDTDKAHNFSEVPMEVEAARKLLESAAPNGGNIRTVRMDAEITLLDGQAPKVITGCNHNANLTCVEFPARLDKVSVISPAHHVGMPGTFTGGYNVPEQILAVVYP